MSIINESNLKPNKEIQKSTLTGWVKIVLRKADIDTSQFKAHSCGFATTSKATAMGISLEGVLKDGNDQVNQHGRNIDRPTQRNKTSETAVLNTTKAL